MWHRCEHTEEQSTAEVTIGLFSLHDLVNPCQELAPSTALACPAALAQAGDCVSRGRLQSSHRGSYCLAVGKDSSQTGLLLLLEKGFCHRSLCFPLEHSSSASQATSQGSHQEIPCSAGEKSFSRAGQEGTGQGGAGAAPASFCGPCELRQEQGLQALCCEHRQALLSPLPPLS